MRWKCFGMKQKKMKDELITLYIMKKKYISPELKVVTFVVEQGFLGTGTSGSPVNMDFEMLYMGNECSDNHAASYTSETDWNWGF